MTNWRYATANQYLEAKAYELTLERRLVRKADTDEERNTQRVIEELLTDAQQYASRMAENVEMVFGEGFDHYIRLLLRALGEDIDLEQAIKEWEKNNGQRYGD